ncbi:alanine racemase [Sebaldella sp. S0638]|uniref:alanine racemase n=1 Tax=Sebaldella sp. S0638 TaxID=2957809 RepID=UPI0020A003B7|nr:alanine racemase [Sebaldella sp. S0638]MCP1224675.1 alanine racemase [Sebaldella sp. S0638]
MLNCVKINKENIIKNLKRIRSMTPLICVVKDDAYGLGIENILPVLYNEGERYYAVAFFEEAMEIRNIYKDVNIIILNYTEDEKLDEAVANKIELSVFSMLQLRRYTEILGEKISELGIHIKFNTGMNRLGFDIEETEELCNIIKSKKLQIKSVFSHISNSENIENTEKQLEKFEKILSLAKKHEVDYGFMHISASPALFKYDGKYNFDFSRVGMAVYGLEPLGTDVGLEKCISIESKIINIKNVRKGEYISYGENNRLEKDTLVGIIPMGYAQGIQMQIENKGAYALVNGKKAPVIGEVCMDMLLLDISGIENVNLLDRVVLVGKSGDEEITLRDISKWTSTIQDDIITKISKKIKRIVV